MAGSFSDCDYGEFWWGDCPREPFAPKRLATLADRADQAADELFYRPGNLVEFIAPGQDIVVAWLAGAIKKVTGSSFAAPQLPGCWPALSPAAPRFLHFTPKRFSRNSHLLCTPNQRDLLPFLLSFIFCVR